MSKISPSEMNYFQSTIADYQRAITEQEEDHDEEQTRTKERAREDIQQLEEANRRSIRSEQEDHAEALDDLRKSAQNALTSEREMHREAVKELKHQTYDQFGTMTQEDTANLRKQNQIAFDEFEAQQAANDERTNELEATYQKRIREINENHAEDLEDTVSRAREGARQSYAEAYEDEKSDYLGLKGELEEKYTKLNKNIIDDNRTARLEAQDAIQDAELAAEHRSKKTAEVADDRISEFSRHFDIKAEESARKLRKSREDETALLRTQLKDLSDQKRQDLIGRAEGRASAIKDFEREQNFRNKTIVRNYENEISKIKAFQDDIERRLASQNFRNLREQETFYTDVIQNKEAEKHSEKQELVRAHDEDRKNLELQSKKEKENFSKRIEAQADILNKARDEALKNQALAFQDTMKRQRLSSQDQIDQLTKQNRTLQTSEDTTLLSPAAERALRKQIVLENQKSLDEQEERLDRSVNSMRMSYQDKMHSLNNDHKKLLTLMQEENIRSRDSDRTTFNQFVHDITDHTQEQIFEQERDHRRQTEVSNRAHARDVERMKRQFNDIINSRSIENSAKMRELRSEAEFEKRMLQRQFADDNRAMIRKYQKRLDDQKVQYQEIIEDLKLDMDKSVRETRKHGQTEIESQQKFYERQIEQLEQQHKERERILVENFEEEIEETRKANARLIRQKS